MRDKYSEREYISTGVKKTQWKIGAPAIMIIRVFLPEYNVYTKSVSFKLHSVLKTIGI